MSTGWTLPLAASWALAQLPETGREMVTGTRVPRCHQMGATEL